MRLRNIFQDAQEMQEQLFSDALTSIASFQKKRKENKEAEERRKLNIRKGKIKPIAVAVNLQDDEVAFVQFTASRQAYIDKTIEYTAAKSKKKGIFTRAIIGGALLGPLGALGGAATAGSRSTGVNYQETVSEMTVIDSGMLIVTNKRLLFIGGNIASLPYDSIINIQFNKTFRGMALAIRYEGMLNGEQYLINGKEARDIETYLEGIKSPQSRRRSPK